MKKTKRATGRDLFVELVDIFNGGMLCAQYGGVKIDECVDPVFMIRQRNHFNFFLFVRKSYVVVYAIIDLLCILLPGTYFFKRFYERFRTAVQDRNFFPVNFY